MPASTTSLPTLRVSALDVSFGARTVLHDLDLTVTPGRRTGLVGENGSGKPPLLRGMGGPLSPRAAASGLVEAPDDLVMLGQEPPFRDDATVGAVLARALAPLRMMVADVERPSHDLADDAGQAAYATALDLAVAHDAWDADRRAAESAERLGLGSLAAERLIGTLSGGQRTRLAVATVMTTRPSCLLLDEPTNHLDDEAVDHLTGFLRELPGVVVLASHDRVLLDDVCTDLFDLDPVALGTDGDGGARFGGGWTAYEEHRAAARRRWEETYAAQQDELARLREASRIESSAIAHNRPPRDNDKFIYGFKGANVQLTLARPKGDAHRRLEVAERVQVRKPRPPLTLRADLTGSGASGRVVQGRRLEVADRLRVARMDLDAGQHLLVTGANGCGKSTLLGVLSGRLAATSGTVSVTSRRVSELVQDVRFEDPGRGARATYDVLGGAQRAEPPPLRALGLLQPDRPGMLAGLNSVCQRRRRSLAQATAA